tara:strand:- start:192 stop:722 length:531 start_codon:yes stop_codon:yes gene_type:complete
MSTAPEATEAAATPNTVKLKTNDGQVFEVERELALRSVLFKNTLDDANSEDATLAMGPVDAATTARVVEYLRFAAWAETAKHARHSEVFQKWETVFMNVAAGNAYDTERYMLLEAANYLEIKGLVEIVSGYYADEIFRRKKPEAIRERFGIKNDFTPAEEEEVRKTHPMPPATGAA